MKKFCFAMLLLVLPVTACQATPSPAGIQEQPAENSEEKKDSDALQAAVKITNYPNEQAAIDAIEAYYEVEQTNTDLGYGVKGFSEGAAGHHYLSWNEGNWSIEINFPTDPVYAISGYENAESLAVAIVAYLDDHFLPPPDERGTIQINGFRAHPETVVQWQQDNRVYTITQQTANPLETLHIAVSYTAKR